MVAAGEAAGALPQVGIPLGILIGGFSGALSLLFLRTLQAVRKDSAQVLALIGQFVGIPGLWLSVPFGSRLMSSVETSRILTSYEVTLAVVWVAIIVYPLIRLIIATGNEIDSE